MGSSKKHKEKDKEKERDREIRKRHHISKSRSRSKERHRREKRERSRSRSKERERRRQRDYPDRNEKVVIKEEKSDSDSETRAGNGPGESSLSIEETNKLRAKLGLKPLDVGPKEKNEDEEFFKKEKEFVHKPAENLGNKKYIEKLREKIAVQRDKRKIIEKLTKTKTLADSDSDDEGALSWVKKSRKIQEEKERANKRAKLLEEMDEEFGVGNLIEDEFKKLKDQAYTSRDLKGMKIEHGQERFKEGRDLVLTLKDKGVLDDDEEDVLVNVNLIDDEKAEKNVELRKKKPDYNAYEEPVDEFGNLLAKKPVLKKYDEEIEGMKKDIFQLGSGGVVDMEKQKQLQELRRKLQSKQMESLAQTLPTIASEFYTAEEMVKIKKPKKIVRKVRKSKRLKADELASLAASTSGSLIAPVLEKDFRSRKIKQENDEDSKCDVNLEDKTDIHDHENSLINWNIEDAAMEIDDDIDDSDLHDPDEDLSNIVVEPDEAELELQLALNKTRKLKQKENLGATGLQKVISNIKTHSTASQNTETSSNGLKGSIVMNATAEFCRALGDIPTYGLSGNRDEDVDDILELERDMALAEEKKFIDDENKQNTGGWNEVGIDEQPVEIKKEELPILEEEPDVSVGLAGALKLAMKKGYLESESKKMASAPRHSQLQAANYTIEDKSFCEDDKYGRRDRYCAGPVTDFKEKDTYRPDVKLEYIDDGGRLLTPKEAFRYLSHKFHGKGSGKNKTEKRMKKLQEEALMRQMSSTDTPLGTLALLQEKQKQTQSPYILLSGGNKALNPNAISKPV